MAWEQSRWKNSGLWNTLRRNAFQRHSAVQLHEHFHDDAPELVAASPNGGITRCNGCGALHLRFGNAVLNLDANDLRPLATAVKSSRRKARPDSADNARVVELYMGESGAGFAFTRDEIVELDELLEVAVRRVANTALLTSWPLPAAIQRRIQRSPNAPT